MIVCVFREEYVMRVIAGKARRLLLETPAGLSTRPTSDKIKETLFNILQPSLSGAYFLDLFAGSGGIGIEALSRGARYACFVDHSRDALKCIKNNLNHTKLADDATVYGMDWRGALMKMEAEKRRFDVVFIDPPYDSTLVEDALRALAGSNLLSEGALIVAETSLKKEASDLEDLGFRIDRVKQYKTNQHWFLSKE